MAVARLVWTCLGMLLVVSSCSPKPTVRAKPRVMQKNRMLVVTPGRPPRIHNFSETEPVLSLAYLAGSIYGATPTQILRYHVKSGKVARITRRQGLPRAPLQAVAAHRKSGLWVANGDAVHQHHKDRWIDHGHPRPGKPITAAVATAGGVWVAGPWGAAKLDPGVAAAQQGSHPNKWSLHLAGTPVTQLLGGPQGIWIGTAGAGLYRQYQGKLEHHHTTRGQQLDHVRSLTLVGEGGLMAAGRGPRGQQLSSFDGEHWSVYNLEPGGRVHWLQQAADGVLMAYREQLLMLRTRAQGPRAALVLQGQSPRAPWGYSVPPLEAEVVKPWLPRRPTAMLGYQGHTLVGTRTLGVALFDGRTVRWFRTNDLLGTRERLRMACARGACYIPGTGGRAFRLHRGGFVPVQVSPTPGAAVQAFANDQWGGLVALHTPAAGRSLVVSELSDGGFAPVYEAKIKIPAGSRLQVRFLRTDPTGRLWVGLWAVDRKKDRQPWGVVVLRPPPSHAAVRWSPGGGTPGPTGAAPDAPSNATPRIPREQPILFHRSALLPHERRPPRSMAVPNDVRDAHFERFKIWLATGDGVCLIRGTESGAEVKLTTENEGIRSELIYGFARSPSGELLVASFAGVGRQQGRSWIFDLDRPLRTATRRLLVQGDELWAGTTQGLARVRGRRAVVYDSKLGLAHDAVLDIYLDRNNRRMWVLTEDGLSIISLRRR